MRTCIKMFALCMLLCALSCSSNNAETTSEEPTVSVVAMKVKKGAIASYVTTTGTIFPLQELIISPKISGRIEKLFVDEGDQVKKGQRLVELEQDRLLILVKEADASLQEAAAQLKNIESTLKRNQKLFDQGVLDTQRLDDVTTEHDLAKARILRAQASLERAQKDLKDSVIIAPFNGFIVEKAMNEGEIATSMPPSKIFHLVDTSRVKIECGINEVRKTSISVDKEALITLDAYPNERFKGKITTMNPKVDIDSRTFKIKIEIPNNDFRLETGMFARIRIIERQSSNALLIPQNIIIEEENIQKVFAVENSKAIEKPITIGIVNHPLVEVVDGLKEGDIVITQGFYALKDGIKVRVKELLDQGA